MLIHEEEHKEEHKGAVGRERASVEAMSCLCTLVLLSSLCSSHRFPSKRDCSLSIEDLEDLVDGRFQDWGLGFQCDSPHKPVFLVWFYFHEATKGPQVFYYGYIVSSFKVTPLTLQ